MRTLALLMLCAAIFFFSALDRGGLGGLSRRQILVRAFWSVVAGLLIWEFAKALGVFG
jgi:hypothetical protein